MHFTFSHTKKSSCAGLAPPPPLDELEHVNSTWNKANFHSVGKQSQFHFSFSKSSDEGAPGCSSNTSFETCSILHDTINRTQGWASSVSGCPWLMSDLAFLKDIPHVNDYKIWLVPVWPPAPLCWQPSISGEGEVMTRGPYLSFHIYFWGPGWLLSRHSFWGHSHNESHLRWLMSLHSLHIGHLAAGICGPSSARSLADKITAA